MAKMTAEIDRWLDDVGALIGAQSGGTTPGAVQLDESQEGGDRVQSRDPALPTADRTQYNYGEIAAELFSKGSTDRLDIDPNDVDQNALGDCFFLAAVAAVARSKPEALRKLIKKNGDGSYDVTLYVHDKWFSVQRSPTVIRNVRPTFPTDSAGNPVYAGLGDRELWVMLLEKAYAIHVGGYDDLDRGGDPEDAIEALGGIDAESFSLSSLSDREILQKIRSALDQRRPIVASSKSWGSGDKKKVQIAGELHIISNHAYSIQGISGNNIQLDNPWGDGAAHGDITISVSDFKRFFEEIDVAEE